MYHEFFGIEDNPFSITPDPRYLYMSKGHQEALAHLLYGVSANGGFVMLTGEVGTGKTSICRCLLEQLPNATDVALILNPKLNEQEFVASVCDELGIAYPKDTTSLKLLVDLLNRHLLDIHAKGRQGVVIIDEAQNLSPDVLEQVRLLTNLETAKNKLLQIILIGQPELSELLARRDMRQLAQRVTARYHLKPLTRVDARAYVQHRQAVAGLPPDLFTPGAKAAIHRISRGIPRLINSICDRCLLGAYVQSRRSIDRRMVLKAADEVLGHSRPTFVRPDRSLPWMTAAAVIAAMLLVFVPTLSGGWVSFSGVKQEVVAFLSSLSGDRTAGENQSQVVEATPETPQFSSVQIPMAESVGAQAAQNVETAKPPAAAPVVAPSAPDAVPGAVPAVQTVRLPESSAAMLDVEEPPEPIAEQGGPSASTAEPAFDIYQVFDPDSDKADSAEALDALFALWQIDFSQVDRTLPCAQWSMGGVRCLRGDDTLENVLRLNRPTVGTLQDSEGNRAHIVLAGAEADTLILLLQGRKVVVERATLEPLWSGNYLVLWRAPALYQRDLTRGLQGPDVAWLHKQLSIIDGVASLDSGRAVFDSQLRQRVMTFQRRRGLEPDGIAGAQTLIHLDEALRQRRIAPAPDSAS